MEESGRETFDINSEVDREIEGGLAKCADAVITVSWVSSQRSVAYLLTKSARTVRDLRSFIPAQLQESLVCKTRSTRGPR